MAQVTYDSEGVIMEFVTHLSGFVEGGLTFEAHPDGINIADVRKGAAALGKVNPVLGLAAQYLWALWSD